MASWRAVPPVAIQLARIASAIGIKAAPDAPQKQSPQEFIQQVQSMGIPVMQGRPDDPMLAFLDPINPEPLSHG